MHPVSRGPSKPGRPAAELGSESDMKYFKDLKWQRVRAPHCACVPAPTLLTYCYLLLPASFCPLPAFLPTYRLLPASYACTCLKMLGWRLPPRINEFAATRQREAGGHPRCGGRQALSSLSFDSPCCAWRGALRAAMTACQAIPAPRKEALEGGCRGVVERRMLSAAQRGRRLGNLRIRRFLDRLERCGSLLRGGTSEMGLRGGGAPQVHDRRHPPPACGRRRRRPSRPSPARDYSIRSVFL